MESESKASEKEAEDAGAVPVPPQEENPLQKELETKKREVVDFTVRTPQTLHRSHDVTDAAANRTNGNAQ